MSKIKFKPEDRWLESDAQIFGRTQQAPHKKGIELTLTMPDGEELGVIVAKLNSASITEFCSMARGHYSERIEEQKAQKTRAKFDEQMAADDARAETSVPVIEATVQISLIDRDAVAAGVIASAGRCVALLKELEIAQKENAMLRRVLEVLEDAQKDISEAIEGTTRQEAQVETFRELYTEAEVKEILGVEAEWEDEGGQ